jgi:hypothetical protein
VVGVEELNGKCEYISSCGTLAWSICMYVLYVRLARQRLARPHDRKVIWNGRCKQHGPPTVQKPCESGKGRREMGSGSSDMGELRDIRMRPARDRRNVLRVPVQESPAITALDALGGGRACGFGRYVIAPPQRFWNLHGFDSGLWPLRVHARPPPLCTVPPCRAHVQSVIQALHGVRVV